MECYVWWAVMHVITTMWSNHHLIFTVCGLYELDLDAASMTCLVLCCIQEKTEKLLTVRHARSSNHYVVAHKLSQWPYGCWWHLNGVQLPFSKTTSLPNAQTIKIFTSKHSAWVDNGLLWLILKCFQKKIVLMLSAGNHNFEKKKIT